MAYEGTESQEYRDSLANELRALPDHKERLGALANAKGTETYMEAAALHSLERNTYRNERSLADTVEQAPSMQALKEAIMNGAFSVPNEHAGMDHSEHLLKRIEMSELLGDTSLLPEAGGLRSKVESFQSGMPQTMEHISYRDFITKRYPDLLLNDEELTSIEQKIEPGIFATIDTPLERSILLANTLPEINSAFSCAGHTEAEGGPLHGPGNVYFVLKSSDTESGTALINKLSERFREPHGEYQSINHDGNGTVFYFERPPTAAWIAEEGKRTPDELFEESKRQIASQLDAPEILEATRKNFHHLVLNAQQNFLAQHPESATIPYAPNSRILLSIKSQTPDALENREYRDFLFAPERWDERAVLIKGIENDLEAVRREAKESREQAQIEELRSNIEHSFEHENGTATE